MAARRPIRISDLISKYGWDLMPYITTLGIKNLAEAQVLFVDSNATNALDADDGYHGHSLVNPLATWGYANSLCSAGESSIIILAPRHNEDLGDEQIDLDVTDVHTIGMGSGLLKPRIDFGHANSSINFAANNVTVRGVDFLPAITSILIGVHFETDAVGCWLKDSVFLIGEDGVGADEFIKAVELTSGNDDCGFEDVVILAHDSASQATHGINVAAAADRVTYRNVIIDGPYATGGIVEAAAGVNLIVENCAIDVSGTNYSFNGASTFAKRVNNVDGQVREDDSESLLVEARGSAAYPSGITNESIWAYLLSASATPDASSYDNETDSLEAIRDAVSAIDTSTNLGTAVPLSPTDKSLQDILSKADGSNTYDKTTDSLEAISEALLAGTGATAAIDADSLDKLVGTSDTDQAFPASIVDHSILAAIMTSDGDHTGYDRATDSLEAIADAISGAGFGSAVSQTPTARSMQDILEKDDSGNFNDADDSLEMISDKAGAFAGTSGAGQSESVKASLDLAHTDLDAILADTISISGATLPSGGPTANSLARFIASGGSSLGQQLPSTMSLIDIIGDYSGAYDGSSAGNNIKADIDILTTAVGVAQSDLDIITGASGVNLLTATQNSIDAIEADTDTISGASLPATPTSGALSTFISGGSVGLGQPLPASTSLVDIIGNFTGAYNGTVPDDNIKAALDHLSKYVVDGDGDWSGGTALPSSKSLYDIIGTAYIADGGADDADSIKAHLDLIYVDSQAIVADTAAMEPGAERVATFTKTDLSGATGDTTIFTIANGPVRVIELFGVVTNTLEGAANFLYKSVPTSPGADVSVSTATAVDNKVAGTVISTNPTFGGATVVTVNGTIGVGCSFIQGAGVIEMNLSGNLAVSDEIKFYIRYQPMLATAVVTGGA